LTKAPFFARRRAQAAVDDAHARYDAGDTEAAWRALESALKDDPACVEAEFLLGRIANDRKQYAVAAEHLKRAAELKPKDAATYGELARAFHELHNRREAEVAYARALELGNDPYIAINFATFLRDTGRFDEATRFYRRAVEAPGLDAETRERIRQML